MDEEVELGYWEGRERIMEGGLGFGRERRKGTVSRE